MTSYRDILTPTWLKTRYLAGVNLTFDDGTAYPDTIYQQAIDAAIRHVEQDLSIVLDVVTFKNERHDTYSSDQANFYEMALHKRPVVDVSRIRMLLNQSELAEIPSSWIYTDNRLHGRLAVVISLDGLQSFAYPGNLLFLRGALLNGGYLPGYLVVDYRAGFPIYTGTYQVTGGTNPVETIALSPSAQEPDYFIDASVTSGSEADQAIRVSTVSRAVDEVQLQLASTPSGNVTVTYTIMTAPSNLLHCIGLRAAMLPLDIAGDLIAGAGVANSSISVDGISQSIGTTSSPTNAGYGARVLQFAKEYQATVNALRGKYRLPGMVSF